MQPMQPPAPAFFSQVPPMTLPSLPIRAAFEAGIGYVWAKIFDANPSLAAKAFAITEIATTLLFHALNLPFGTSQKRSQIIYACTQTAVTAASIVAYRQLNLIGRPGTGFMTLGLSALTIYHILTLSRINDQPTQNTQTI